MKTGDPEIIVAYKERLQEANDEFLAAKREQEALKETADNVSRAIDEVQAAKGNR